MRLEHRPRGRLQPQLNHIERVRFLEIDPDAMWAQKPTTIRLSDITRVDFGGGYEEALRLVGGEPEYLLQVPKA